MHTERSERPRGSGFSEKGPTILIAAIPRLTFRFGAVSCENKKLTSNGEHLFGQIDQSRRSLESLFFVYLRAIIIALARYLWSDV